MKHMIDQFCEAIDRAYKDDPEKLENAIQIFSRVCERTLGVVLVAPGDRPSLSLNGVIPGIRTRPARYTA